MYEQKKNDLIESLKARSVLHDPRLELAFRLVPLEEFIPDRFKVEEMLYEDTPQIFYKRSQVDLRTIAAPHMICIMLEYLNLDEADELLILGSKSGYIAALASFLCTEGHIYIVDSSEEIVDLTRHNLAETGFDGNISVIHGNPLTMAGTESLGLWNKILVPYQVAEHEIFPALGQLKNDGVLFAPIGGGDVQFFTQIIRKEDRFYGNRITSVIFAPLEKNVTFLSQQVDFSDFMKKTGIAKLFGYSVDNDIENAKKELEASQNEANDKSLEILYDTPEGDRLHEEYRQRTLVPKEYENADFKLVEQVALELAARFRGKVRLVTLFESFNIPIEVLYHYLRKSKKGVLKGSLDDPKTLVFVAKEAVPAGDPEIDEIIRDLKENVTTVSSLLENEGWAELEDLLQHYQERIQYLEIEKDVSMKNISIPVRRMLDLLEMLGSLDAEPVESRKDVLEKITADLGGASRELKRLMKKY
jgi:protein-L-isoaspartate(D-aspartate) O-methyltransferase